MHLSTYFLMAYIMATLTFIIQRTHLLMTLLCLEGMMLCMVLMIPSCLYFSGMMSIPTLALILLTLGACEASLGLSIMVVMSRTHGADLMNNLTMAKC